MKHPVIDSMEELNRLCALVNAIGNYDVPIIAQKVYMEK